MVANGDTNLDQGFAEGLVADAQMHLELTQRHTTLIEASRFGNLGLGSLGLAAGEACLPDLLLDGLGVDAVPLSQDGDRDAAGVGGQHRSHLTGIHFGLKFSRIPCNWATRIGYFGPILAVAGGPAAHGESFDQALKL